MNTPQNMYMSLWRPATFERALSSYGAKITMATIGQVKDLLKKELEPLNSKLETMSTEFSELRTSVQLFSVKHDDLLKQIKQSKEKLHQQRTDLSKTNFKVNNIKKDLRSTEERITNACFEIEELGCTLEGTVWKYQESRRRATAQPNPLFNQLAKLLMFQLTNKIFLLRTLYRLTMLLLHQK